MRVRNRAFIAGLAGGCILLLRRRSLGWGATRQEHAMTLPGDDLIPSPDLTSTRATTIHAPGAEVWPWIAQLGQGRGGFYSYEFLENLVGCDIHNADRIVPEWQVIGVGDQVRLAPEVALEVAAVDQGRSLVLRGGVPMGSTPPPYDFSWAFVVQEQMDVATRLVVRERYAYTRWWAPLLVEPVEVISFVMHEKMLRGIRDRARQTKPSGCAGCDGLIRS
jgi:hypothetical protein